MLDDGSLPSPRRRALAGVGVGLAVGLGPLVSVVCGVWMWMLTYPAVPLWVSVVAMVAAASGGALIGVLSGSGWGRSGSRLTLLALTVAMAVVVVPALFSRQNHTVGTVVWAVLLVPVVYAVAVLVRRGARLAGAAAGLVGGLLAVDAGVTSLLAWLVRDLPTFPERKMWLWFLYLDGRTYFPNTLYLADEVSAWPHALIAATAFLVCLTLVTQRDEAIDPSDPLLKRWSHPMPSLPAEGSPNL